MALRSRKYRVKITFLEPILGSQGQKDVMTAYVNPATPEDELAALPEKLERGTTTFHKDEQGNPLLFNYQIGGFLKAAASEINSLKIHSIKALKSKVERDVMVEPRKIPLLPPDGWSKEKMDYNERPLRAETAQGPRVALARSEQMPAGTQAEFVLDILEGSQIDDTILSDILDYGRRIGLGQWHTAQWGSFTYEIEQLPPNPPKEVVEK